MSANYVDIHSLNIALTTGTITSRMYIDCDVMIFISYCYSTAAIFVYTNFCLIYRGHMLSKVLYSRLQLKVDEEAASTY